MIQIYLFPCKFDVSLLIKRIYGQVKILSVSHVTATALPLSQNGLKKPSQRIYTFYLGKHTLTLTQSLDHLQMVEQLKYNQKVFEGQKGAPAGLPLAEIYYFTLLTHCLQLQFSHSKLNSIKYPTNVVTLMFASMCIIALDNISNQDILMTCILKQYSRNIIPLLFAKVKYKRILHLWTTFLLMVGCDITCNIQAVYMSLRPLLLYSIHQFNRLLQDEKKIMQQVFEHWQWEETKISPTVQHQKQISMPTMRLQQPTIFKEAGLSCKQNSGMIDQELLYTIGVHRAEPEGRGQSGHSFKKWNLFLANSWTQRYSCT